MFGEAVNIDTGMRNRLAFTKEPYLHTLRKPLVQAKDLGEAETGADIKADGFGNERVGHYGM